MCVPRGCDPGSVSGPSRGVPVDLLRWGMLWLCCLVMSAGAASARAPEDEELLLVQSEVQS